MNVMMRCTHCGHLLWLWQDKSPGKTQHLDCWIITQRMIQKENQHAAWRQMQYEGRDD